MKSEISIIVPVYNAEKYLSRCIDSILGQTFNNFECILINDGSLDNSPAICDDYARKDSRIRVIHQENRGVSAARNVGIDASQGKWIGFVDSDDWIEPTMYEQLYLDACKSNADVIICSFFGQFKKISCKLLTSPKALELLFLPKGFGGFSFLRLVKAQKIKGKVKYSEKLSYMEDIHFFYKLFKDCHSIYWHTIPLYHYEDNPESITNQYGFTNHVGSAFNMLQDLIKNEENNSIKKAVQVMFLCLIANISVFYIKNNDLNNKSFIIMQDILEKKKVKFFFNNKIPLKTKCWGLIAINNIILKLYYFYKNIRGNFKTL